MKSSKEPETDDNEDSDAKKKKQKKQKKESLLDDEDKLMSAMIKLVMEDEKKNAKLNLAGLLNVLDGVIDCPGRIIIMTTNHPEKLDPRSHPPWPRQQEAAAVVHGLASGSSNDRVLLDDDAVGGASRAARVYLLQGDAASVTCRGRGVLCRV
ncbi:hypothetical protein PINS_up023714 [Pythium insidiosum]|nr:hypothetical protein PINS_up023714 [Pythium insidiosum]